jgi:hypothetical protein
VNDQLPAGLRHQRITLFKQRSQCARLLLSTLRLATILASQALRHHKTIDHRLCIDEETPTSNNFGNLFSHRLTNASQYQTLSSDEGHDN